MKPILVMTLTALAISACTRTDERLVTRAMASPQAAPVAADKHEPLATLPPMSPDADDLQIVDYQ